MDPLNRLLEETKTALPHYTFSARVAKYENGVAFVECRDLLGSFLTTLKVLCGPVVGPLPEVGSVVYFDGLAPKVPHQQPPRAVDCPPTPAALEPTMLSLDVEGYERLAAVLVAAYNQSAKGKGKERHATGLPFHNQPIVRGAKDYGVGGPLFQVGKKSREAYGMVKRGHRDKAIHELYGAIVYAAAAIVTLEDMEGPDA